VPTSAEARPHLSSQLRGSDLAIAGFSDLVRLWTVVHPDKAMNAAPS
jgi:hypothetical protein